MQEKRDNPLDNPKETLIDIKNLNDNDARKSENNDKNEKNFDENNYNIQPVDNPINSGELEIDSLNRQETIFDIPFNKVEVYEDKIEQLKNPKVNINQINLDNENKKDFFLYSFLEKISEVSKAKKEYEDETSKLKKTFYKCKCCECCGSFFRLLLLQML